MASDDLIVPRGEQPEDDDHPYVRWARQTQQAGEQRLRGTLTTAVTQDPEQYARRRRVAAYLGYPEPAVEALPDLENQAKIKRVDEATRDAPVTRRRFTEADFARLSVDDPEGLSAVEQIIGAAKYITSAPGAPRGGLLSDVVRAGRAIASGVPTASAGMYGAAAAPFELVGLDSIGGWLRERQRQTNQVAGYYAGMDPNAGMVEHSVMQGFQSAGENLAMLPAGFARASWATGEQVMLGLMGLVTGGQSYGKARDKGIAPPLAAAYGLQDAVAEVVTEKYLGAAGLLNQFKAGASAGKLFVYEVTKEVPGEIGATLWQNFNEWANVNPEKSLGDWLREQPEAIVQTIIGTLVGGSTQIGALRGIDRITSSSERRQRQAEEAEARADLLDRLTKAATATKLLQRDPHTFAEFVQEAAADGPVQAVYIDARTFAQTVEAAGVTPDELPASVRDQLGQAVATGTDLRIPVGEYAAAIAPQQYAQSLIDHLRIDPADMSRTQAREYMQTQGEELSREVERMVGEQQADSTWRTQIDAVKASVRQQLADTQRFREPVNEAYSSLVGNWFGVMAARLNTTPQALFERYRLSVQAQGIAGGRQFEQAAKRFGGTLAELADLVSTRPLQDREVFVEIGRIGDQAAERIAAATGLQTAGARIHAYSSDVYSDFKAHPQTRASDWDLADTILEDHDAVGRSIAQRGAQGERITLFKRVDSGEAIGVVYEVFDSAKHGRRLKLKGLFRDKAGSVENWFRSNTREALPSGLAATGGDPRLPNNPDEGPNRIFPEDSDSIVPDDSAPDNTLERARGGKVTLGRFDPATNTITLLEKADLSTFLHELGHFFLETHFDIAAQLAARTDLSEAEREVVTDANALLKWFGVPDLPTWFGLQFEEKRAYHEQFARGFEAYLFEGRAPSLELSGLFQRFRAFLLRIYQDLKALNVTLTDEVRSVMDRMLASTEAIKLAEQARSMMPVFDSAQSGGMTPEEFAAYQAQGVDASNAAIDELQARALRDLAKLARAKGREVKRLQRQAVELRATARMAARAEIMSQPVYRAWQFLTGKADDGAPVGKLDRDAVDAAGLPADAAERLVKLRMTAREGGLHPELVAEQFGFESADELLRALAAAQPPAAAIEAATDARMLEEHGELSTPEAIERAAEVAIHNEHRANVIATEMAALAKALGEREATGATDRRGRQLTRAVLPAAAREFAAATIARLQLRNLKPGLYTAAEARAARAADQALRKGDTEQAFTEKRNQLLNNHIGRAALAAQDEVEAGLRYLRKFARPGVREALATDYLDQIDALLERYDLRRRSALEVDRAASLRTWVAARLRAGEMPDVAESLLSPEELAAYRAQVQSRDADGELVYAEDEERVKLLAEAIDRSARRPYSELTVEAFRGLVDTVKSIEHLGRLKNRLLTARETATYEAVRDEIAAGIAAHASRADRNTRTATDVLGRIRQSITQFGAAHIKAATWARIMDGGDDNGPVWRYLIRPANERASFETTMRAAAVEKLDTVLRPILANVSALDKVGKGKAWPSLGGVHLNWQERFAIALNAGNESNLQRLLDGRGWTMQGLVPVLNSLTAAEWHAVQAVWDHLESYRPLIAAKEKRVAGKEPEWIAARPITVHTADGQTLTLRGGYYPVKYDPRVNQKASQHSAEEAARERLKAASQVATTRRTFVKSRVEEVRGRPVLLNLQALYGGVSDVIHDLAWHEWAIDANRLLRSSTIDSAIREHYGPEVKREFEKWRDDIVIGSRRLDHVVEQVAGVVRQNVSAAALTYNVISAAMQPLGLANSMARVGVRWAGKGLARYAAAPIESTREAQAKSDWLRNRARTRFRELNELRNQVQGQTAARELMGRYGYWLMVRTQLAVDVTTWWAGYERAIAGGHDEATAVAIADQAVKDSQGGGEEVDQSGIERGGPLVKLFTAFYGFMGTTLNTAYVSAKTARTRAEAAAKLVLVLIVPTLLGEMLKAALVPGGDDDDEALAKKLIGAQLSFLFGLVAFGREFAQMVPVVLGDSHGRQYTGPAGLRLIADTYKLAQQAEQGEFDAAFGKAFITVLGGLTGLPAVQINRTITGAIALDEGETDNPAAILFGFQRH